MTEYTTLFLDVGGVLLTNGWDRTMRAAAAKMFDINVTDFDKRHALTFDTYEIGKITLDEYLERTIFYKSRSFSKEMFREFIFAQSQPHKDMIDLIWKMKKNHDLTTVALTNEGREIMHHRIEAFHLKEFIDIFVCSAYIGLRKPDADMYRFALDLSNTKPSEVIYIDDRDLFIEVGHKLGLKTIHHKTIEQTKKELTACFQRN